MESDRDRTIETLLRDTLGRQSADAAAHLDAETAAAWADGALSPDERGRAERHAASCARCQALVAALVKTAPPASARASWFRFSRVAWLAPLTAAAAAVIFWAVMPAMPKNAPRSAAGGPAELTIAESRPTAQARAGTRAAGGAAEPPSARDKDEAAAPRGKNVAPQPPGHLDARAQTPVLAEEVTKELRRDEAHEASKLKGANEKPAEPAAAPLASPAVPAAPPPSQGQSQAQTPSPAQLQSSADVRMRQSVAIDSLAAKSAPVREIAQTIVLSPNPNQLWRLTPNPLAAVVEYSIDGGRSWTPQLRESGTVVTAGASPSPAVCWLIGPRGTVLITTDARTWQRLAFPEPIDLINVRATDDKNATVTALDGRVFATANRGATWTLAPKD
ncbi:MAG TPA: zf-HC2 domain-containing protein [Vicinamibacterales bacterium]|nr:zf-HC2 domain-containing protein [Vicinamibacterales bacterium]